MCLSHIRRGSPCDHCLSCCWSVTGCIGTPHHPPQTCSNLFTWDPLAPAPNPFGTLPVSAPVSLPHLFKLVQYVAHTSVGKKTIGIGAFMLFCFLHFPSVILLEIYYEAYLASEMPNVGCTSEFYFYYFQNMALKELTIPFDMRWCHCSLRPLCFMR